MKSIVSRTLKESGTIGLYRGLGSMVYFAAPKAATRFTCFETASGALKDEFGGDKFGLGKMQGERASLDEVEHSRDEVREMRYRQKKNYSI